MYDVDVLVIRIGVSACQCGGVYYHIDARGHFDIIGHARAICQSNIRHGGDSSAVLQKCRVGHDICQNGQWRVFRAINARGGARQIFGDVNAAVLIIGGHGRASCVGDVDSHLVPGRGNSGDGIREIFGFVDGRGHKSDAVGGKDEGVGGFHDIRHVARDFFAVNADDGRAPAFNRHGHGVDVKRKRQIATVSKFRISV